MTTPGELRKILRKRQIYSESKREVKTAGRIRFRKSVRSREVTNFTRQLATMVQAHLPLAKSLEITANQQKNSYFKQIILVILGQVKSGKSLSESLSSYPKLFSSLYVNMLRVGEISGNMSGVLEQLSTHREKMSELKRKVLTAMAYPSVIVLVAIGAVSFLIFGVIPSFVEMFQDFNAKIPLSLRILINTGNWLKSNVIYFLILFILLFYFIRAYIKTEKGQWVKDLAKLKCPLIGTFVKKVSIARFAGTLGTLLSSGVPLLEAMETTAHSLGNVVMEKYVLQMRAMAEKGEPMEKSFSHSNFFPELLVQMIAVGEETAELPGMLNKTAEYYESEVDAAIEVLTSVIEPVIIVVLGIVLGSTIVTIYLQIFDLMNVIQ